MLRWPRHGCAASPRTNQQPERFQKTFSIAPGGTLDVDNYKGTIHVTGSDTNQVAIDVNKHFEGNDADRKWWMENVQINFRNSDNRVSVEVKYPQWTCTFCWHGHDYTAAVELEIHVPRQINVQLETYKPDIRVSGIQGDIRVKSYKSPIEIADTTGAVRIDTYKETVRLRNVNLRGPLEIKSYKAEAEIDARSLGDPLRWKMKKAVLSCASPPMPAWTWIMTVDAAPVSGLTFPWRHNPAALIQASAAK